jgi:hypothetical protein
MGPVEVEGAAALELAGVRFSDGEVADVLADLRKGTAEERAVAGEAVDEGVDLFGVLKAGFTNWH